MDEHFWWPKHDAILALPGVTLLRFPQLSSMLSQWRVRPLEISALRAHGFLGWGRKLPAQIAADVARRRRCPFWTLEDGFLRSIGLGKQNFPAFSCVLDDLGIYYDAATPSRLERLIAEIEPRDLSRASFVRKEIVRLRLTKYNHLPDRSPGLPRGGRRLLLVDQVSGDFSVRGSQADEHTFSGMLQAALEIPDARIVLRIHPDVMAGCARGFFSTLPQDERIVLCDAAVSPHALIDEVDEVWTVSSQLGFDALLRGVPVRCFAAPFYAGWGLTLDTPATPAAAEALRRRSAARVGSVLSLDELVDAALLRYPLYFDPARAVTTSIEAVLDRLSAGRAHIEAWRGSTLCAGTSWHKRPVMRAYCAPPGGVVTFSQKADTFYDRIVVWGAGGERAFATQNTTNAQTLIAEDGFIRSIGLGSAKVFPLSLCFDSRGIYYDATRPSDLELMLETAKVGHNETKRAAALRNRIVASGISKYNLKLGTIPELPALRRRIIVFGQVPEDESLRLGADPSISNLDFLRAVRSSRPDDFIVFKEHPDLLSGGRHGSTDLRAASKIADYIAADGDALTWIKMADEVHVRTSLAGYEALLRGKKVVCYGLPFYAGWGLTTDFCTTSRRTRRRSLDELVAITLLRYPVYLHPRLHIPINAEDALALIEEHKL